MLSPSDFIDKLDSIFENYFCFVRFKLSKLFYISRGDVFNVTMILITAFEIYFRELRVSNVLKRQMELFKDKS